MSVLNFRITYQTIHGEAAACENSKHGIRAECESQKVKFTRSLTNEEFYSANMAENRPWVCIDEFVLRQLFAVRGEKISAFINST